MHFVVALFVLVTTASGLTASAPVPMAPWNFEQFRGHPLASQFIAQPPVTFACGVGGGSAKASSDDPFAHRRDKHKQTWGESSTSRNRYAAEVHARRAERSKKRRPGASSPCEIAEDGVDSAEIVVWQETVKGLVVAGNSSLELLGAVEMIQTVLINAHRYDREGSFTPFRALLAMICHYVQKTLKTKEEKEAALAVLFKDVDAHSSVWQRRVDRSPLFWSSVANMSLEQLKKLIEEKPALVDLRDDQGCSVLFAVNYRQSGADEKVLMLIDHGVDINAVNEGGFATSCFGGKTIIESVLDANDMAVARVLMEVAEARGIDLIVNHDRCTYPGYVAERLAALYASRQAGVDLLTDGTP